MTNSLFTTAKVPRCARQTAVLLVVSAMFTALLAACNMGKTKLAIAVEAADNKCPYDFDNGEITGIEMDDGDVVFSMTFDQDVMLGINVLHSLNVLNDVLKYSFASATDDEDTKELFSLMADAGAGMRLNISGRGSGSSVTVDLTAADVEDIASGNVSVPQALQELNDMADDLDEMSQQLDDELDEFSRQLDALGGSLE